ncbi:MAG: Bax inhibitor-1/YccA family protein [Enterococcus sp.]|nr:Bax inhibitor-1/YccA family protein [Enterococcus sp.]
MASPVFTDNSPFVAPEVTLGNSTPSVMTIDNTIRKSIILFAIVLAGAGVGWFIPGLYFVAALIGLVLGLVISFKKSINVPLIVSYAAFEGIFVGGLSSVLENVYPGVVLQSVLATFAVIGTTLLLFTSGKVRTSPKMTKFFLIAMTSYLVFSLINVGLQLTGIAGGDWGLYSATVFGIPLGFVLGIFAVLMGAYSLIMDFEHIQHGVRNRLPEKYGWLASFGLVVTVIWIYVEILRLISIIRGN